MVALLGTDKGIACRACGATYAYASKNAKHSYLGHICDTCINQWEYHVEHTDGGDFNEQSFNKWLADSLGRSIKRLKQFGVTTRCEALIIQGTNWITRGYQCGNPARLKRNGRWICTRHAQSEKNKYVGQQPDPYKHLEDMLTVIAHQDDRVMQIVSNISAGFDAHKAKRGRT